MKKKLEDLAELILAIEDTLAPQSEQPSEEETLVPSEDWLELVRLAREVKK